MITAFGNNFGAGAITFRDFQKDGLVVLNGTVTVDPSNDRYQAAERLVISVPATRLQKSACTSVYLVVGEGEHPQITIVKSWFAYPSNLYIERLRKYESLGVPFTYIFCCAYLERGKYEAIQALQEYKERVVSQHNYMLMPALHYRRYDSLLFLFGHIISRPAFCIDYMEGEQIVFDGIEALPGDVSLDFPVFCSEPFRGGKSFLCQAHVRSGQLVLDAIPKAVLTSGSRYSFGFQVILVLS